MLVEGAMMRDFKALFPALLTVLFKTLSNVPLPVVVRLPNNVLKKFIYLDQFQIDFIVAYILVVKS